MPLYGRKVIVQLNNESFDDLRVDFSITKTLGGKPNKGSITIYNMADVGDLLKVAQEDAPRVRLLAGYNDAPGLLIDGFPAKDGIVYSKSGPDRTLKITVQDGLKRYQNARVSASFSTETSIQDVLVEVVNQLGLPIDTVDIPPDIRLTQGVSLEGQASDILDRLARSNNADWSIQDGKFVFLQRSSRRNGQGPLFSHRLNNIIGVPQKNKDGVTVPTLITGPIIPGSLFRLETKEGIFDGDYKTKKVDYRGSSWGGDFTANVFGTDYQTVAEAEAARLRAEFESRFERRVNPNTGEIDEAYRPPEGKGVIPRF